MHLQLAGVCAAACRGIPRRTQPSASAMGRRVLGFSPRSGATCLQVGELLYSMHAQPHCVSLYLG